MNREVFCLSNRFLGKRSERYNEGIKVPLVSHPTFYFYTVELFVPMAFPFALRITSKSSLPISF
jgi:hypothetical protein